MTALSVDLVARSWAVATSVRPTGTTGTRPSPTRSPGCARRAGGPELPLVLFRHSMGGSSRCRRPRRLAGGRRPLRVLTGAVDLVATHRAMTRRARRGAALGGPENHPGARRPTRGLDAAHDAWLLWRRRTTPRTSGDEPPPEPPRGPQHPELLESLATTSQSSARHPSGAPSCRVVPSSLTPFSFRETPHMHAPRPGACMGGLSPETQGGAHVGEAGPSGGHCARGRPARPPPSRRAAARRAGQVAQRRSRQSSRASMWRTNASRGGEPPRSLPLTSASSASSPGGGSSRSRVPAVDLVDVQLVRTMCSKVLAALVPAHEHRGVVAQAQRVDERGASAHRAGAIRRRGRRCRSPARRAASAAGSASRASQAPKLAIHQPASRSAGSRACQMTRSPADGASSPGRSAGTRCGRPLLGLSQSRCLRRDTLCARRTRRRRASGARRSRRSASSRQCGARRRRGGDRRVREVFTRPRSARAGCPLATKS